MIQNGVKDVRHAEGTRMEGGYLPLEKLIIPWSGDRNDGIESRTLGMGLSIGSRRSGLPGTAHLECVEHALELLWDVFGGFHNGIVYDIQWGFIGGILGTMVGYLFKGESGSTPIGIQLGRLFRHPCSMKMDVWGKF